MLGNYLFSVNGLMLSLQFYCSKEQRFPWQCQ